MTRCSLRVLALVLTLPLGLSAQTLTWGHPPVPKAGACFYNWPNFDAHKGKYFCRKTGQDIPNLPKNFNNAISSIRILGGVTVRIYDDFNFQGHVLFIRYNIADLRRVAVGNDPQKTWNNRISSISVRQR